MASLKTLRIVTTSTSTLYNLATGSTSVNATPFSSANKGVEVVVQNQSTGATDLYVGGSDLTIQIGATSTSAGFAVGGIKVTQGGYYSWGQRNAPSAIQLDDYYIMSTSSNAVAVVQLIKAV